MEVERIVISGHFDPDFGALELTETRAQAQVNGGPWKPMIFREWFGRRDDLGVTVRISSEEDPPLVADEIRTAFRTVVADVSGFKRLVARRALGIAEEWASQGELKLPLDEEVFSDLLALSDFSVEESRLTVYLKEAANIFPGHTLEVRIERGEIIEICLAG